MQTDHQETPSQPGANTTMQIDHQASHTMAAALGIQSASGGSAPQTTIQAVQHDSSVNGQNQTGINDDLDAVMDAGTPRDTTSSQLTTTMDATTGQTQLEQQRPFF